MNMKDVVANNVKFYRTLKGWTIEELSGRCNVSVVTISNIENKKIADPKLSTIVAFAETFGVSIEKLLQDNWTEEDIANEEERLEQIAYRDMMDLLYPPDKRLNGTIDDNYISCLLEFLVYLPLIDIKDLYRFYAYHANGIFVGFENYIIHQQIEGLIRDIPDSKAKEHANITVEGIRRARVSRDLDSARMYIYENQDDSGLDAYNQHMEKMYNVYSHLYQAKKILSED